MVVGVLPAGRRGEVPPRPARVVGVIRSPEPRRTRAIVRYVDTGTEVEVRTGRLVALP